MLNVGLHVVRHSVDFGFAVTVMTRGISCQPSIDWICSETIASQTQAKTGLYAALPFGKSTVKWQ
jgi:hypothetical protein